MGAFGISLVSLWFSFLNSPLSDVGKPQIQFSSIASHNDALAQSPTASMVGSIENLSRNPAEHLVVSIATLAADEEPEPPKVIVQSGIEYSIISQDKNFTVLKFETFPAYYSYVIVVNSYRIKALKAENDPLQIIDYLPGNTSVSHKYGYGARINSRSNSAKKARDRRVN
jgi:hypothetical protein